MNKQVVIEFLKKNGYKFNNIPGNPPFENYVFYVPSVNGSGQQVVENSVYVYPESVNINVQGYKNIPHLIDDDIIKKEILKSLEKAHYYHDKHLTLPVSMNNKQWWLEFKCRTVTYYSLLDKVYITKFKSSNLIDFNPQSIMTHGSSKEESIKEFYIVIEDVVEEFITEKIKNKDVMFYDLTTC